MISSDECAIISVRLPLRTYRSCNQCGDNSIVCGRAREMAKCCVNTQACSDGSSIAAALSMRN